MKKTILVTGGAGFLGSHLSDRFLREGFAVIAMDNLITGSTDNISHLIGRDDFLFIHHDVTQYVYVEGPLLPSALCASPRFCPPRWAQRRTRRTWRSTSSWWTERAAIQPPPPSVSA